MKALSLTLLLACACAATHNSTATKAYNDDDLQSLKQEVMKNPFANRKQFTVDFSVYASKDWHYPFPGAKVISSFGDGRHHAGTDLKTTAGARDTLYAAFAGVVTLSESRSGYGNLVLIRHANGLETAYGHNRKNLVQQGQWVVAGQPIAIVGRTGRASTEHLHFEVRVDGQAFDSSKIFDHSTHQLRKGKLTFTKRSNGHVKIH
ncbi:MAG: M23 family metallopeptidase [Prevotellaceae bacterium]|nr:M23 family metallopeptidase [Prevotellaceae bacterium]